MKAENNRMNAFCLKIGVLSAFAALFLTARTECALAQLPSDVRANHWAASAVKQVLANHVMPNGSDGQFHGEAHVTRQEAAIALATLAKQIEGGGWHLETAKPLPDKVAKVLSQSDWKTRKVTRYEMASALARFANYFVAAVSRPQPGAKDLAKSNALPEKVTIAIPKNAPAYSALQYLAAGRMIGPGSDLLTANTSLIQAAALSKGIAQVAAGLVDKMTELGLDSSGSTPDSSFHNRKTASPATNKP